MEYKYIIRYPLIVNGERRKGYFASIKSTDRALICRSFTIGGAYFFDTIEEANLMLKNEKVRAGMGKVIPITEKEVFKIKLAGG